MHTKTQTRLRCLAASPLSTRRFLSEIQNWVNSHASPHSKFKATKRFLEIFPKMRKHLAFDHIEYHLHTL